MYIQGCGAIISMHRVSKQSVEEWITKEKQKEVLERVASLSNGFLRASSYI